MSTMFVGKHKRIFYLGTRQEALCGVSREVMATHLIFILSTTVDTLIMMIKYYCTIGTTGPDEMNLTKPPKNGFELNSE